MGTWEPGLYENDEACDLRTSISVVCKVPAEGNQLLAYLLEMYSDPDPTAEDGVLFWLIVADQFETCGISCKRVMDEAMNILASGLDLQFARDKEADAVFLREREKPLQKLAMKLRNPRNHRERRATKPPEMVLAEGQVLSFRTMNGVQWHPYRSESLGPFVPDGWGAIVVLASGRSFNWLPWVALASITINSHEKPTFEDAVSGKLMLHPQTDGAGRFIPKRAHARGLGLELLGNVRLDSNRVKPLLSKWSIVRAIQYDWTIAYAAITPRRSDVVVSVPLKSLIIESC